MAKTFEQAAEDAKKFSKKPTDQELLDLYSLYKQATVGDCNTGQAHWISKAKPNGMPGMEERAWSRRRQRNSTLLWWRNFRKHTSNFKETWRRGRRG